MAKIRDLFDDPQPPKPQARRLRRGKGNGREGRDYTARDIEVLEGLDPVRRRPGMYIGSTDTRGLHHLAAEILDNAMDEAVAGHANRIEIALNQDGTLNVRDNGRGIPTDPHPKFKSKSALEVIMTTLHAGGKFGGKVYDTSGGLHGVGASVVNALSEWMEVEVARDKRAHRMRFERGKSAGKLKSQGAANWRGTNIRFKPDHKIFGKSTQFSPKTLYQMARSKAYLFRGVEIRWKCDKALISQKDHTPAKDVLKFPGGLLDYLNSTLGKAKTVTSRPFVGLVENREGKGALEWAISWSPQKDAVVNSYCNTIPTLQGGTHEQGLRGGLTRSLRAHGERAANRKTSLITPDDVMDTICAILSVFVREPEFQGQTKEKLASPEAQRLVENIIRDHFDHWLAEHPKDADALLATAIDAAETRLRRREEREVSRKAATRKLRLPGKLSDCTSDSSQGSEIFLVEGDSAGGSAKQARNRVTQAILPLRGKILNVASATAGKLQQNQELADLVQALGCGSGSKYRGDELRYERVIIMTDADVDGAHIASLLLTFFFREMPDLIDDGHLFLAMPPLYRLTAGGKTVYAIDDKDRERLLKNEFRPNAKVEVSRFKGLGEMMPSQLKETTMKPGKRHLIRVKMNGGKGDNPGDLVERLMGKRPELRFQFIQENAVFAKDVDI